MNLSDNSINLFPLSLDGLNSIISDSLTILNQPVGVLQIDNNSDVYSSDDVKVNSIQTLNSGIITINSNIVSKDIIVENLIVTGNATFNQNISINNLIVSNNAIINNSLIVSNNVIINNSLIVSGNNTFGSNLSISGLFISNNTIINRNLRVSGNATFGSNVSISGLFVSNNILINRTLIVSGNTTFGSNVSISGLFVSNNTILNGSLIVSNNATFGSNISTSGLSVSADSIMNRNLIVSGNSTFGSNVSISGLFVSADSIMNRNLRVSGNTTFGSNVSISGLSVSNNSILNGTLTVNSNTTINGNVSQNGTNMELLRNGNVGLSLNSDGTNARVFMDFNSFTGVRNDYDARQRVDANINSSGIAGRGFLSFEAGNIEFRMPFDGGIRTTINGTGFLGINCNPTEALEVSGTIFGRNQLIISGNATFGSNVSTSGLFVSNNCNILGNLAANSVSISANLTTTGLTRINTLIVGGNATFNSNCFFSTALVRNLIITASTFYTPGSIYSDPNWGFLLRSRVSNPTLAVFSVADFSDNKLLIINQSGNFGIGGVSNPTERLDIIGNANFNNRLINNNPPKINFIKSRNGLTTNNLDYLGSIEGYGTNTSNAPSRGAHIEFEQNNNATSTIAGRIKFNSRNQLGVEREHIRIDDNVIIDYNSNAANLFLNGDTSLGQDGMRFIYNAGTAYMDVKGPDRLYFRLDNTAGGTTRGWMTTAGLFSWGTSSPMNILSDGQVSIPNMSVGVNTAVSRNAGNGILTIVSSDRRIKSNIKDLDDDYVKDFFKKVRPVMYDFHKHVENNKEHIGFIAQELEELLPPSQIYTNSIQNKCDLCKECSDECLHKDKCDCLILKDCKSFNNYAIISLNTKRIQLLVSEIEDLKEQLVKERIQYKLLRDKQDKKILEQGLLIDKIVKSLANKSIFIK